MEVLTEDCSGRIVTGETGLAHTRTGDCQLKFISSADIARCRGGRRRGSDKAQARTAPPQQGWRYWASGGANSPIVDDEGCDFLCSGQSRLAELIEIEGMVDGDGQDTGRSGWSCLPSMLID